MPWKGGGTNPFSIQGSVNTYAELPDATTYDSQLWFVKSPKIFTLHPRGIYYATGGAWEQSTIKVKWSEDAGSVINWTDWSLWYNGSEDINVGDNLLYNSKRYVNITGTQTATAPDTDITNWSSYIDLNGMETVPHQAGRIWYNSLDKVHEFDTGYTGVRYCAGKELFLEVYNNTLSPFVDGDPIAWDGTYTSGLPNGIPSDASSQLLSIAFAGVSTMTIPPSETGFVVPFGVVHGVNTQSLVEGFIYTDENGWYTQTRPLAPLHRRFVGAVTKTGVTDGIILVNPKRFTRTDLGKSYSFTSQGIGAGLYYKGGFYDWSATSITLDQGSLSTTYGTAGRAYAAHAGIVPQIAGTVDTGQVGLRVQGIEDSETGIQVANQYGIITDDITTLTADVMAECSEKFSGTIIFELYVVSGSPVNYSLTFNYGYSKYDDLGNKDFTLTGIECVWQGNALDTVFDIALKHHKPEGWTYAATGFIPGNGDIARKSIDQTLAGDVNNNEDGAWKRVNLDVYINGSGSDGIMFEIITGQNNTIQTMDLHIQAVSEDL